MENKPTIMYVKVSENCNSNCFMCHYAGKRDSYNITMKEYKTLLNLMDKDDYRVIRFTGGEPLLHPNIIDFIKEANDRKLYTSIITNGFLLKIKAKELVENGLNQCIISLDGSNSEVHDSLRNFKHCFDNIMEGITMLRKYNPEINIRINTVVSGRNIHDITNIYDLLVKLKVDQWSIIPVKYKENIWDKESINYYKEFRKKVKNSNKILFLGDSKNFAGNTEVDIENVFENNGRIVSNNKCKVVDFVRFYIPDRKLIVPCNCISHRLNKIPLELNDDINTNCEKLRMYLKENSKDCTGCEPLNVYINNHSEIMFDDEIKF